MATLGTSVAVAKLGISFPKPVTKHHPILVSSKVVAKNYSILVGAGSSSSSRIIVMATETEKLGIKIVKSPPESKLSELRVRSWPKWGCPPSKFPWTYSGRETCYLLEGKVKVYPEGSDEAVEIGAGDLVVFPKGMTCTWDVSQAVDKHYQFD